MLSHFHQIYTLEINLHTPSIRSPISISRLSRNPTSSSKKSNPSPQQHPHVSGGVEYLWSIIEVRSPTYFLPWFPISSQVWLSFEHCLDTFSWACLWRLWVVCEMHASACSSRPLRVHEYRLLCLRMISVYHLQEIPCEIMCHQRSRGLQEFLPYRCVQPWWSIFLRCFQ